jgi:hypothetical protein
MAMNVLSRVAVVLALCAAMATTAHAGEAGAQATPPAVAEDATITPAAEESRPTATEFFAQIKPKMTPERVMELLGAPSRISSGQSGKGWIPFYHGSDLNRVYWSYKGLGIVVFSENAYRGTLLVFEVREDANAP